MDNITRTGVGPSSCLEVNGQKNLVTRGFDHRSMRETVSLRDPGISTLRQIEGLRGRLTRSDFVELDYDKL